MRIFTYILFSILICSFCAMLMTVIASHFWLINIYNLSFFTGCPLLLTLLLLFSGIRKVSSNFQRLDYLLTGINTAVPTAFLSCFLLYRWWNGGDLFTETILFLMLSLFGLIVCVLFSSFIKLSVK